MYPNIIISGQNLTKNAIFHFMIFTIYFSVDRSAINMHFTHQWRHKKKSKALFSTMTKQVDNAALRTAEITKLGYLEIFYELQRFTTQRS